MHADIIDTTKAGIKYYSTPPPLPLLGRHLKLNGSQPSLQAQSEDEAAPYT